MVPLHEWRGQLDLLERERASSVRWLPNSNFADGPSAIVIDPADPKVSFTDAGGVWRTDDITAKRQIWQSYVNGLEEMVVFNVKSPPRRAPLLSAVADHIGFEKPRSPRHRPTSLDIRRSATPPQLISRRRIQTSWCGWDILDTPRPRPWLLHRQCADLQGFFSSNPNRNLAAAVSATSRRIVWLPKGSVS
jgi:xyloglucan-specific exo-beta-1,4-glucanase